MNRIYQGKIVNVEIDETANVESAVKGNAKWKTLPNWHEVIWKHHELFQDAVNYYMLALAALAKSAKDQSSGDPHAKAIGEWVKRVEENWITATRKAVVFEGPGKRLTKLLDLSSGETNFDGCADKLLTNCKADNHARFDAVKQLLKEANGKNLNQVCVDRLACLCNKNFKGASKETAGAQARKMREILVTIHEAQESSLSSIAPSTDPGLFLTQYPPEGNRLGKEATIARANECFDKLAKKETGWNELKDEFKKAVERQSETLPLYNPGRKTKGSFPYALVFRYLPCRATWESLKRVTAGDYKKAKKDGSSTASAPAKDFLYALRGPSDSPPFDYFTNIAMPTTERRTRARWFEFDLAAFIEAIQSPHRYYEDSLKRMGESEKIKVALEAMEGHGGKAASATDAAFIEAIQSPHRYYEDSLKRMEESKKIKDDLKAMEGRGGEAASATDDENDEANRGNLPGFEGDTRIGLIRRLVGDTLSYLAEDDGEDSSPASGRVEYSISERTLRSFPKIRDLWREIAKGGSATVEALLKVATEEQALHRDDFGSAALYRELAKPEFHPIWRNPGTEGWHAKDPLKAWLTYKDIERKFADMSRPIRFTPAHSVHSPRYFDFPKTGAFKACHQSGVTTNGSMSFTATAAMLDAQGNWVPSKVRISYAAPRLMRDGLRSSDEDCLSSVPWLQPMMSALGLEEPDRQDFKKTRITLMARREPDSARVPYNIQLVFPVEANASQIQKHVSKGVSWGKQFNYGGDKTLSSLRWPHEKRPQQPPERPWWTLDSFSCLSVDLGQRDAGAFARIDAFPSKPSGPFRFIGEADGRKWFAKLVRQGLLRLPGEDALVWRERSMKDRDPIPGFALREELYGEKGRKATAKEAKITSELLSAFGMDEASFMPTQWTVALSFPEQNDKLLIAARRAQSRIAKLLRWAWFLDERNLPEKAYEEILDADDEKLIPNAWGELAKAKSPILLEEMRKAIHARLESFPKSLVALANRILPLRGRSWTWKPNPEKLDCHLLSQDGPAIPDVLLAGQRGLSMERIEQIGELRKRFQSLNQTMRRKIGGKAPARRDDSIPDCCPGLLDKLDRMKEQRVNQTAHMILAEALGLKLAPPPNDKKLLKASKDIHGQYVKTSKPVSFIVIENLSRYRSSQGRAPRENSRLMKWCHRAVCDKLKQLCEVFGLDVLEVPAAYSSRFCSRSGVAGFRAVEVSKGFESSGVWSWLAKRTDKDGKLTEEAAFIKELSGMLSAAPPSATPCTLLIPQAGGSVFVPVTKDRPLAESLEPKLVQADINAAINLGLRAIASPLEWSIHPRIRTERSQKALFAKEKRRFGEKASVPIVENAPGTARRSKEDDGRNPNFFADFAHCAKWGGASLSVQDGNDLPVPLVIGKALWGAIKESQYVRCREINMARLEKWGRKSSKADQPF